MKIGAQMFTIREFTKTTEAISESLKKIADIGYTTVQISGTCGFEAEWMRDELKKDGLNCVITHTAFSKIKDETEKTVFENNTFGCKYIGLGSMPHDGKITSELLSDFAKAMLPVAEKIRNLGSYFMYHNHSFEFEKYGDGDETVMEYLTRVFPTDVMGFTLDSHWVKVGGRDPSEYLQILKGRTPCIHYKDLIYDANNKPLFAPVGAGILDFDEIIKTSIDLGVEYALVEQDDCYGEDPFVCLKKSYDYLKSMGLN